MNDKKVTIYDIAERTNLSIATVHRALNNKGRISTDTRARILKAAEELGYRVNAAAQGLRRATIKIGAVLFCPVGEYVNDIVDGIRAAGEELEKFNVSVTVRNIPYTSREECLKKTCLILRELAEEGCGGIVLFVSSMLGEMKELTGTMLELAEEGVVFATVANDIPGGKRALHVGVDAFMAGSMAAEMMSFSCARRDVALLVASSMSPVNQEYINGFRSCAGGETFSGIFIYEHYDDPETVLDVTARMLEEHPDLGGIYMTTASSALACRRLRERKRGDMFIITTDLLKQTPALFREKTASAAIFQNPYKQGKNVVKYLYRYITAGTDGGTHLIPPQILLSSNLSPYLFFDAEGKE